MFWKNKNRMGDIIIPVLGATGAGKSTFINILIGKDCMKVGSSLSSCTGKPKATRIKSFSDNPLLKGRSLVIVDTPGFDDTVKSDIQTLQSIADYLKKTSLKKGVIGGVIYLHDVTSDRMPPVSEHHLEMLQDICGPHAFKNIVLGTTKWNQIAGNVGSVHEKQLEAVHWEPFRRQGSQMHRFEDNQASAWKFIETLLPTMPLHGITLEVQKVIDQEKANHETVAGRQCFQGETPAVHDKSLIRRFRQMFCI
ncbi:P-loop containing nucleoside triphosphate hydrolase protein [Gymnopilus junonius]|uniref:P-loop containing nucleoside triphosphate hydrolase protein n=1 Tax=Gymnopilus junonius TaxID=109634 RepID=A0A9P5TK64_GYMJU|nr:P-loop containing nucleoside triphosphate hydrolase protein [Gymnopilus junonius]